MQDSSPCVYNNSVTFWDNLRVKTKKKNQQKIIWLIIFSQVLDILLKQEYCSKTVTWGFAFVFSVIRTALSSLF